MPDTRDVHQQAAVAGGMAGLPCSRVHDISMRWRSWTGWAVDSDRADPTFWLSASMHSIVKSFDNEGHYNRGFECQWLRHWPAQCRLQRPQWDFCDSQLVAQHTTKLYRGTSGRPHELHQRRG